MTWIRRIRLTVGWLGLLGSVALLASVVFTYARQPDHLAAFTVMPVWVWGDW